MTILLIISILIDFNVGVNLTSDQVDGPFDWLLGLWERSNEKPEQTTYEKWIKVNDEEYSGKGWMIKQQDTTFMEYLTIQKIDQKWYYTANVSHNKSPVSFHIHLVEENYFIAENMKHDFPKKIEYRQDEIDSFTAIVSDHEKSLKFNFRRFPLK